MNPGAELIDVVTPPATTEAAAVEAPEADDLPVTVIERRPGWRFIDLGELWRYRELLFFLTWRDIKVRYKQTVLGAAWAIIQPFATMLVFSLFFGRLAEMPAGGVPYPLFVFAGLLPWYFFANAITSASGSVVGSQNLVTKVYFPRLIIPLGAIGPSLVDFAIGFGMLLALMLWYGVMPGWEFTMVPLLSGILLIAATGVGTLLSALTVAYRDFRYVVPFMVQLWMFATPSIYLHADAYNSPRWDMALPLNPANGLIYNFRQALLGGPLDYYSLELSSTVAFGLMILGCAYFRRVEREFADII